MFRSKCLVALCASMVACLEAVPAVGQARDAERSHASVSAPTPESVRELLAVMGSRQLVDDTLERADESLRVTLAQMLTGKPTAEEQAIVDDLRKQSVAILREGMQWDALEPRFMEIYQASFTQDEVDGMLAFYRSDAGNAVVAKMPGAMQRTMMVMQELVAGMMPRLRELQNDALEKLKAVQAKKPGG